MAALTAVVAAVALGTNRVAHGSFLPPYAHRAAAPARDATGAAVPSTGSSADPANWYDYSIELADGRRLSLGQALAGRPALLMPLDYACRNVCDPMLAVAGTALSATGLAPGRKHRLSLVEGKGGARRSRRGSCA